MKRAAGDIVHRYADGTTIRYSPSMGSSVRYRVACRHGVGANARTLYDARESAREIRENCKLYHDDKE